MKKQFSRLLCAALIFAVAMSTLFACGNTGNENDANEAKYNQALSMIESGDYEGAYAAFKDLGEYKDSKKHLARFIYFPTVIEYVLYDRTGVMTIELGEYNMPSHIISVGTIGTKDGSYTYDEKGNLIQQAVNYNGTHLAYDYTYDANNNMIRADYSVDGVVTSVYSYVYDENGMLISESYTEGDVVKYNYEHTYDENGNRIKIEYKTPEGTQSLTYTYNENGLPINESAQIPNGFWYTNDYTYNSEGALIQRVYAEQGGYTFTTNFTYDRFGNNIKQERFFTDGTVDVYTKEYDANGNVTKEEIVYSDDIIESAEWQYTLTYLTIDIPTATMDQIMNLFVVLKL